MLSNRVTKTENRALKVNYNQVIMSTEKITPLTTEHLRLMREDIARFRESMETKFAALDQGVDEGFADLKKRLSRVEQTMVGLKRDEVETAAEPTEHRHTLDRLDIIMRELRERISVLEARAPH